MSNDKISKIIIKLNRETKEDKIKWVKNNREMPSSLSGSEGLVGLVYYADVIDKTLRLYKYNFKSFYDEVTWELQVSIRLEFVERFSLKTEYIFPEDRSIDELYETVLYKTSGVERFADEFLNQENSINEPTDDNPFV